MDLSRFYLFLVIICFFESPALRHKDAGMFTVDPRPTFLPFLQMALNRRHLFVPKYYFLFSLKTRWFYFNEFSFFGVIPISMLPRQIKCLSFRPTAFHATWLTELLLIVVHGLLFTFDYATFDYIVANYEPNNRSICHRFPMMATFSELDCQRRWNDFITQVLSQTS